MGDRKSDRESRINDVSRDEVVPGAAEVAAAVAGGVRGMTEMPRGTLKLRLGKIRVIGCDWRASLGLYDQKRVLAKLANKKMEQCPVGFYQSTRDEY